MAKAVVARQTAQRQRADPQRRVARPAQRGAMSARAGIDRLQRALGNRGMYHLLRLGAIQAKLAVGPADDGYEREAERVADDVMRMPETPSGLTAQRTEEELQRASVTQAPSGGGAAGMCPPLPDPDGDWAKEKWLCEMRLEAWGSNARLLAPGAKGRSVELLHQVMHHWLCWISPTKIPEHTLPDPESNLYTEATGLVVKDFQKFSHAVMQEGIVGPETISLLDGYVGGPDIPPADCGIPEPKPEPEPETPTCTLPVMLGSARGCGGGGTDFTHFDFPALSTWEEVKFSAWAMGVPGTLLPRTSRWDITDAECEDDMDGTLRLFAGSAGHDAFVHFVSGGGTDVVHAPGDRLADLALDSGSFDDTKEVVRTELESQLAAQAASGTLDPCALSVTPPETDFGFADGFALKAVIGGTQGEELFCTGFSGNAATRRYSISLRFDICDHFGVDNADLYGPGLFAFWALQHERSASRYIPFINRLELPVPFSGSF